MDHFEIGISRVNLIPSTSVAVRSSAARRSSTASFAGRQDTSLGIQGEAYLLKLRMNVSFTQRAIYYRHNKNLII